MGGIIAGSVIGGCIVIFLAYILIKALLSSRDRVTVNATRKNVSEEKLKEYTEVLADMIRCKTVYDEQGTYADEYKKFYKVLEDRFPTLTAKAVKHDFDGCFLYEISGKNAVKNILLMSHHDVVIDEGEWEHPAFEAKVVDGAMYGRGTIDTKTPLFAELMAVEELLKEGYDFEGINVFIGSSNNEEVAGDGFPKVHKYFLERGLHFDVVLDEGGAITEKMMPGVKEKSAMVAVHEKGRHRYECVATKREKGHVGLNPTKENAIDNLSAFISEVKDSKIFKKGFAPEVEATFRTHAPYMPYPLRIVFSNFCIFKKLLLNLMGKVSPVAGAMLSTTMSFTKIEGTSLEAKATAFFRCIREDALYKEIEAFKEIAKKYNVEVRETERDYCVPSKVDSEQFKKLKAVLNKNFPDVIVSPFLLTAGTDARHLGDVADAILRFAPIDLDSKQYATIHNANEHIKIYNVGECVCFYRDFILSYK